MSLYPNITDSEMMAVDIETFDPYLTKMGSGVYRKDGYVVGVSIATKEFSDYYNIGHRGVSQEERNKNIRYLTDILGSGTPKVGANLRYDIDWLQNGLGIKVGGDWNDIQVAEPLLDSYKPHYTLEIIANQYLKIGKKSNLLQKFCDDNGLKGDYRQHIWLMPYEIIREYAIGDATEPLDIFEQQKRQLEVEGLVPLYNMEIRLTKLLIKMRKNGIRIDRNKVDEHIIAIENKIVQMKSVLYKKYGKFNHNSSKQLAVILDKLGVKYTFTEKDNPNIDKLVLEKYSNIDDVFAIKQLREADKVVSTFLRGAFTDHNVGGRIHGEFIPLKSDEGGAVTGRLSCRNPNLQQIPSKGETYGTESRSCFIPEEGQLYGKIDYSQIEYRIMVHYAIGPRSSEIKQLYRDNPDTDYHTLVQGWIESVTGTKLERKKVKNLNFGTAYFMGPPSMSRKFNWPIDMARELNRIYFENIPFMIPTRESVINVGKYRGYVRTVLGRRARLTQDMRENRKEYKLWNYLVQGTAADIMKMSMVTADRDGLFDVLTPHITVHDELGVSVPDTREGMEAYKELKHVMENTVILDIPLVAEAEIGPSWGETTKCTFKEFTDETKRQN